MMASVSVSFCQERHYVGERPGRDENRAEGRLDGATAAKLKTMLVNGDPGARADFPIYVRRFRSATYHKALPQLIMDPVVADEEVLELMMLGWQFLVCQTPKYGELVLKPGKLVAIDVLLEDFPEGEDIRRVIAEAGFSPAPAI
ncbi:hypothetical protein [Limobrevibacterium gyesilva]|uniref:Uncharacterized protein n=1 Tax=Limobrevibacterium gyesilva TaxID=2991712 RepID=A0AA41YWD9_9PROT|nr:hypothetical protein [Limobrevibacterium gyesilva]MCW3477713.1 hypothetical protein [Limobrevibacterium gyesilva]